MDHDHNMTTQKAKSRDHSPIIQIGRDLNFKGLSKSQFDKLMAKLGNSDRELNNFLDQIDQQKFTIQELEEKVKEQKNRIEELLNNPEITEEIKALVRAGDIDGAEALVDAHYEEKVKIEKTQLAARLYERGEIKALKIKYPETAEMFEQAAALQSDNTLYLNKAGIINHTLARYTQAIHYFKKALTQDLNTYGEDHPDVARDHNNLGMAYHSLGRYEKAINYLELALATFRKVFPSDHPNIQTVQKNLESAKLAQRAKGL